MNRKGSQSTQPNRIRPPRSCALLASAHAIAILPYSSASADELLQAPPIVAEPGSVEAAHDGRCSLVEAIENANANRDTTNGECPPGNAGLDIIRVKAGVYLVSRVYGVTIPENPNDPPDIETTSRLYLPIADNRAAPDRQAGLPPITEPLALVGYGEATVVRDGGPHAPLFRLFDVKSELTVDGITVQGGSTYRSAWDRIGDGGCFLVRRSGALTLAETEVRDCVAESGGAISVDHGRLILDRALIVGNRAELGEGGAPRAHGVRRLRVENSLFASRGTPDRAASSR